MRTETHDAATRSLAWLRQSLARGTAVLVIGIGLVASLLMSVTAARVLDQHARRAIESRLEDEATQIESALSAWHTRELAELEEIAQDAQLLGALSRGPAGDAAARRQLADLLAKQPEGLGLAVVHGPGQPTLAVSLWLPEGWPRLVQRPPIGRATINSNRIDSRRVDLISVPIQSARGSAALWIAVDPLLAFDHLAYRSKTKSAVLDETGALIGGTQIPDAPIDEGLHEVAQANGPTQLVLSRRLGIAPWRVVTAEPLVGPPMASVWNVVLANLLIACVAGGVAFWVGFQHFRPLRELAEAARRLASGDFGVRMDVPEARGEVRTLAHSFNEMAEQLKTQRQSIEDRHQQLLRANEVLEQLSITDGLTHLHNHRHFHDQFARETKRADRNGAPLCLLLIDLDDFKALNDRYGHAVGDHLLSVAAGLMNAQVRESDYLARYGGEEFAMLLPQTPLEGAVALAEKVRAVLSDHSFVLPETEEVVRLTVSIGVAQHVTTPDDTFDAADRALYDAKASGKDCVIAAPMQRGGPRGDARTRR